MQAIIDAVKSFLSTINFEEIVAKIKEIVNQFLGTLPSDK